MRKLEIAARDAWAEFGTAAREFVALGFTLTDESVVWYPLTNTAGVGEFLVEDDEVRAVLREFHNTPEMDLLTSIVLWHSHYLDVEPSSADIAHFPEWLSTGMVFHAPSGKTTLYNAAGIIRISDGNLADSRDTQVDFGKKRDSDRARFYGGLDEDGM